MPATIPQVAAILNSPDWTEGEKFIVKWQFNKPLQLLGDFEAALAEAIARADMDNLVRLHAGFPHEVAGFIAWSEGDLGDRLRRAGLPI